MEEDLSRFCCQNPDCPDYGQRGLGHLTVCGHYGKTQRTRLLYCRTCKARFSERKGTPLFRGCLPEETAIDLIEHLAERTGVRATARLLGVHRDTVVRYSRVVGEHARQLHDELVAFSPSDPRGPAR
jgi:transposase-like protein